jgi:electron transfer flavoprotein beta subunit
MIVCVKAVPGYINNPRVSDAGDRVEYEAGSLIMNESDEYAVETAVALKKELGGEVTVVTAGNLSSQKALQTGLAKDADTAIRVDANLVEPGRIAMVLAEAINRLDYDLILTGVESRDTMAAQVGVLVAEVLGLPFAYAVTQVKRGRSEGTVEITKELGAGVSQVVEIAMPALLCIQTGTTPLSFVPFRKTLRAQSKPMRTFTTRDLGCDFELEKSPLLRILEIFSPQETSKAELITGSPSEVVSAFMKKIKEIT